MKCLVIQSKNRNLQPVVQICLNFLINVWQSIRSSFLVSSHVPSFASFFLFYFFNLLKAMGKLVAKKLMSSGRWGFGFAQDLASCTRPAAPQAPRVLCPPGPEAGLLPAARFSCSPGGFVLPAASALCCWLELAQKTMTLKGLFEGNLSIILNLSNPSVCWSSDIASIRLADGLCTAYGWSSYQTGGRKQKSLCIAGELSLLPSRCNLKRSEGAMTDVRRTYVQVGSVIFRCLGIFVFWNGFLRNCSPKKQTKAKPNNMLFDFTSNL